MIRFSGISKELEAQVLRWQHELHTIPEVGFQEFETTEYLKKVLEGLDGVQISQPTPTGLVAELKGGKPGKTVAYRTDIDALPITEAENHEVRSIHEGVMHACGHDGHTSMLLGAARAFKLGELKSAYNLRFAFQPAEEMYGGAARMIAAGVLPEHLAGAFGFHLWPQVPYGKFGWRKGTLMASNDRFTITITGKGAHAAMQNAGKNALQAGAMLALELPRLSSRILSPSRAALIFVGTMNAGSGYNIVADRCTMEGTCRALTPEDRDAIEAGIKELASGIAALYGVQIEVEYVRQYPPLLTHESAADEIRKIFPENLLWEAPEPFMTAEDFAYFTEKVNGGMLLLGTGREDYPNPLHSSRFTFDENLMALGVKAYGILANGQWGDAR